MVLGIIVVFVVGSLVINYLKTNRSAIPEELLNQQNSVETSVKTHKVSKGENLWIIAEKYYDDGFKWVDIATENKLANASVLEIDQELVIPNISQAEISIEDELTEDVDTSTTSYTVVKGDTLWSISLNTYGDGYKWTEIARQNNLLNPNVIHAGNVLILPR